MGEDYRVNMMHVLASLRDAIHLNNAGVKSLNNGQIESAIQSFQRAVAAVKLAAGNGTTADDDRADDDISSQYRNMHDECTYISNTIPSDDDHESESQCSGGILRGLQHDSSYLYNRPLLIPTDITIQSIEHLNSVVLTSSTYIIFNFALACHFVGISFHDGSSLIRATRLYELTLTVLASAKNGTSHQHEMHSIVECLTMNNLGQMHYDQCDYHKCQSYMDAVYDIFLTVDCIDSFLDEYEMNEIMLNLVYLRSPPVAKAA